MLFFLANMSHKCDEEGTEEIRKEPRQGRGSGG